MKQYWILFVAILLIGIYVPCEGLLSQGPFQDFIDNFVDIGKFKEQGLASLNSTAMKHIWDFFKAKFQRYYSTTDEEKQRINIFREHLKNVIQSNLEEGRTYKLGMNNLSDWTKEEFLKFKTGLFIPNKRDISDDENNEESFQSRLTELDQDEYDLTRLKRSLYGRRNHRHRSTTDWDWFNNDGSSTTSSTTTTDGFDSSTQEYDNENNEESFQRRLIELDQDKYYLRGLKRRLHRIRNGPKRFFSDWFWFNTNNSTTTANTPTNNGFDWRTKKVVSSIKDQGQCGSCWAFATSSVMESAYAIKTKSQNPPDFSPQQLVDCATNGNYGCNGGLFDPSVQYLSGKGGNMATFASYPYTATQGTCKTAGLNQINLGTIRYGDITPGDQKGLTAALVQYGPMFIGLHVEFDAFMFYQSGVINVNNCPNTRNDIQHALTLVGYGYDNSVQLPYWIIKNSWGVDWGENGYVRLAQGTGNMCGITMLASWATLT